MQVNGDSTFDCGRHLLTVSTVCQLQQLLMRKYSAAMEVRSHCRTVYVNFFTCYRLCC